MNKRQFLKTMLMTVAIGAGSSLIPIVNGAADAAPVYKSSENVAINGYDPVGYFTMSKPIEGNAEFKSEYEGALWLFSSAANKAAFDAEPAKYAPKYGGYCAFAMSKGAKAPTAPDAWTIVDGKLYLNYSVNVRTRWNEDRAENIKKADINWPNVR